MNLTEQIRKYNEFRSNRDRMKAELRDIEEVLNLLTIEISNEMLDSGFDTVSCDGYTFSVVTKTRYARKSDEELFATGCDFFGTLRDEGLGDLIKETVAAQTLNAALKAYEEEHGALSTELSEVINTFETVDISRRKATRK